MIEVGVRELKSRLSYYLQLMQAGETIAIKMRHRVVGFLSNLKSEKKPSKKELSRKALRCRIEELKKEGFLLSGGLGRLRPFKPVKLKGEFSSTELIRKMRDEEW